MNDVDNTKIERSGKARKGHMIKRTRLETMLRDVKHHAKVLQELHAKVLQELIDELPPPTKFCFGPCEPFSGLCPVCGGRFSTKDTHFKRIKREDDLPLAVRLVTEDGHPACDNCGNRFASDLMQEMWIYYQRFYSWEELGDGCVGRVRDDNCPGFDDYCAGFDDGCADLDIPF